MPQPTGFPLNAPGEAVAPPTAVSYELRPEELARSMAHQVGKLQSVRRLHRRAEFLGLVAIALFLTYCGFIIGFMQSLDDARPRAFWYPVEIGAAFGAILLLIVLATRRFQGDGRRQRRFRRYYLQLAKDPEYRRLLGPYRLEISPENVRQISDERETAAPWRGIDEIVADDELIFFELGAAGCLVVPRRAFADDQGYWAFARLARQYRRDVIATATASKSA